MKYAAWLVASLVAMACASTPPPAAHGAESEKAGKGPLKVGPLAYFEQNCAHCHGPFGDTYTDHFYTITDFDKLKVDVKRMADGPGQASIDGDELTAQVDFHKALIAKGPFISWVAPSDPTDKTLMGEVTKGAELTATAGGASLPVTVKKWKWTLELPNGVNVSDVVLKATLDKKETTLKLGDGAWSQKIEDKK